MLLPQRESIMPDQTASFINYLLSSLGEPDLSLLRPHIEPVRLKLRQQLEAAHEQTRFVYFIESGLASMVARSPAGKEAEVGMMGREGMTGSSLALGDQRPPFQIFMQM